MRHLRSSVVGFNVQLRDDANGNLTNAVSN